MIQVDLDHARNVLQLRQDQVTELEGALGKLDAVDASRNVLRVEYQTQTGGDSMLSMDSAAAKDIPPGKQSGSREKQGGTRSATTQKTLAAKAPRKQRGEVAWLFRTLPFDKLIEGRTQNADKDIHAGIPG